MSAHLLETPTSSAKSLKIRAPYLLILCLDYVLRTSIDLIKENSFTIKTKRQQKIVTDADNVDDLALLANTPTQVDSLLYSLEQATGGISPYVNANNKVDVYFELKGTISTQSGQPLKLVDPFTYLDSNISSTESDINIRLGRCVILLTSYK